MDTSHYLSLLVGYLIGTSLWFLVYHFYPSIWKSKKIDFQRPAIEFGLAIIAVIAIIGIGQLYINNLLIPSNKNVLLDSLNQLLIFTPVILLVIIRKQSLETLWLPIDKIGLRVIIGFFLGLCSLIAYWITRQNANDFFKMIAETLQYRNLSYLIQVFLEDVTIALIFVRLSAWIGNKWSLIIVAILFAGGHIPSMLANGVNFNEFGHLVADTILAIIVFTALSKSKDIWWFVLIHYFMDMTQFYGKMGG